MPKPTTVWTKPAAPATTVWTKPAPISTVWTKPALPSPTAWSKPLEPTAAWNGNPAYTVTGTYDDPNVTYDTFGDSNATYDGIITGQSPHSTAPATNWTAS